MSGPVGVLHPPVRRRRTAATVWAVVVGGVVVAATAGLQIDWRELGQLPAELLRFGTLMFTDPDWELFEMWRSISMAWIGAILCVVLSIPLGILAARGVGPRWVRLPLRGIFAVIRAVPEVIIALLLLTVTGLTPLTGALALGIAGIGTQAKWVYETIESAEEGTSEAVRAAGGTTAEVARWALWPAVAPALMSFALYHLGGARSRRRRWGWQHARELHELPGLGYGRDALDRGDRRDDDHRRDFGRDSPAHHAGPGRESRSTTRRPGREALDVDRIA